MIYLPWDSIENVPANIGTHKGVKLTLAQANRWAVLFDAITQEGGAEIPAAVAWAQWNREYKISEDGGSWEKREKALSLSLREINTTTVLQGSAIQALLDKYPPQANEKAFIVFRKRQGDGVKGWNVDELLLIDEPTEDILKDILWEGEFMLFEVHPDIGAAIGHAIVDEIPAGGIGFKIEHIKNITPISEGLQEFECECLACGHKMMSELHCREFLCSECGGEMRRVERPGVGLQEFEPPEAGEDAPEQVKSILKAVYQSCREKWAKANPDDVENAANKESCSKQSWAAVKNAGWEKNAEGKWVKGTAASLSQAACEILDDDCPTCEDDKMFSSTPKLQKLSEEEAGKTGATELLMLNGTAIAAGLWKGTDFPVDVLKEGLERVSNKRIDVEHDDETWEDVKGFNYKPRWNEELNGIDVSGAIFDQRVIDWYKANPDAKIGLSVRLSPDAKFEYPNGQKTCTYFDIKGIALTLKPACKVCWVQDAEAITLSRSSDDESDGGIEMADKKKTPEELAAEKKLADEKLADEKKAADAKKLEDEKKTKLAAEKAKEDKLKKEKEDAATAKLAAADSTLSPELEKRFSDMEAEIKNLTQANKTLNDERSLSETKDVVDDLIASGQLSEAKREDATKTLMALSSNEERAAFLNTIGGQDWKGDEKGLVLSEEDKDKDKDKDLEFSEPDRGVIT